MSNSGSRAMAIGLTIMLLSVSAGVHFNAGGVGLLLSFTGVLAGANLVTVGVRMGMADGPAPTVLRVFDTVRALSATAFVRRNAAAVGLVMASSAFTAVSVSGEAAGPVLCFAMFALLLLGVSLIHIGARG